MWVVSWSPPHDTGMVLLRDCAARPPAALRRGRARSSWSRRQVLRRGRVPRRRAVVVRGAGIALPGVRPLAARQHGRRVKGMRQAPFFAAAHPEATGTSTIYGLCRNPAPLARTSLWPAPQVVAVQPGHVWCESQQQHAFHPATTTASCAAPPAPALQSVLRCLMILLFIFLRLLLLAPLFHPRPFRLAAPSIRVPGDQALRRGDFRVRAGRRCGREDGDQAEHIGRVATSSGGSASIVMTRRRRRREERFDLANNERAKAATGPPNER